MVEPLYTPVPIHNDILDWIVSTDRDLHNVNALTPLITGHKDSQVTALCNGETDTDHDLHEGAVAHVIIGDAVIGTFMVAIGPTRGTDRVGA